MLRVCLSLVAIALLGLTASRARAAEVEWRAPSLCPDADELRFRIERVIAMPLSHAAPLRIVALVQPSARGVAARIRVEPSSGSGARERRLVAADCSQLSDMVTVAVALALGAEQNGNGGESNARSRTELDPRVTESVTGLAESRQPTGAEGAGPQQDTANGSAALEPSSAWGLGVSLWVLGDGGSLPAPGLGAALGVRLERERFQLQAIGTVFDSQQRTLPVVEGQTPGADLALAVASLSACVLPFGASGLTVAPRGCAGWELGQLSGEGTGVQRPRSGASLWSGPRLDVGVSWPLGSSPWRLGALLTLVVPLARENFSLRDIGSVHRPPAAVGRAAIGLEWAPR